MKKIILVSLVIVCLTSCRKEWDNYRDISSTWIDRPQCSNSPQTPIPPQPVSRPNN